MHNNREAGEDVIGRKNKQGNTKGEQKPDLPVYL